MENNKYPVISGVKLVGIYGKSGAGKDTLAEILMDLGNNTYSTAFADPLKQCAADAFGMDLETFYEPELKEKVFASWGISPRHIAQFMGTEMFRKTIAQLLPDIGEDFWVKRMQLTLDEAFDSGDTVIITDVRFQNEYDFIIANGGKIIHLTRPDVSDTVGIPGHASEASNINLHCTERTFPCLNNGSLEHLEAKAQYFAHAFNLV